MKTILITGIGGVTPRSIANVIRKNHPDYRIIGCDMDNKAIGFFLKNKSGHALVDEYYLAPASDAPDYFSWIKKLIQAKNIDYAFVQPEREIVEWGHYFDENGNYPCPVFMPSRKLSESLKDKSIMADLLKDTEFIPKTVKVTQDNPRFEDVKKEIGFPCWIRATEGTGGLGSLKLKDIPTYKSWLYINNSIEEFTVSEYLPGRHLANEMMFIDGEYVKGAGIECVEYIMSDLVPSHVTGNTKFGRLINDDRINQFCNKCMEFIQEKLDVKANGIFSFDLKEDSDGNIKVTEVNIRHMAYTGILAQAGFDLVEDTIRLLEGGNSDKIDRAPFYHYDKPYVFLRDIDTEYVLLDDETRFV